MAEKMPLLEIDPSIYPIWVGANNGLFNTFFQLFLTYKPDYFKGSKVVGKPKDQYELVYDVDKCPVVTLGPVDAGIGPMTISRHGFADAPAPNISLAFPHYSLDVYTWADGKRGNIVAKLAGSITIYGAIYMDDTHQTAFDFLGGGTGDQVVAEGQVNDSFNDYLVVAIGGLVEKIKLPEIDHILDTDLDAGVTYVAIGKGPDDTYWLNAYGDVHASHAAPTAGVVRGQGPATGVIEGSVDQSVIQKLINKVVVGYSKSDSAGGSVGPFGAKVSASFKVTALDIDLQDGKASATVKVHANAKACIKVIAWACASVSGDGKGSAKVSTELIDNDKTLRIKIYDFSGIKISFDWPSFLKPILSWIDKMISAMINAFLAALGLFVDMSKIYTFTLPDTIPGVEIPADLSFTKTGIKKGQIVAGVNVAPPK